MPLTSLRVPPMGMGDVVGPILLSSYFRGRMRTKGGIRRPYTRLEHSQVMLGALGILETRAQGILVRPRLLRKAWASQRLAPSVIR